MKKNITISELQEILFWQSLNKQVIALKNKGYQIKENDHDFLQAFCFQNKLFSKITKATILDETKLFLISDFNIISFITVNIPLWEKVLSQIMPNAYLLDCTKALADSFDVLSQYDKKYNLTQERGNIESDDEELYAFINQYINLRKEKNIKDFSDVIDETHRLKSFALRKIMLKIKDTPLVSVKEDLLAIDLNGLKKNGKASQLYEEIEQIYRDDYCHKVEKFLRTGSDVGRRVSQNKIMSFLKEKFDPEKTKKSINEFVRYELSTYKREVDMENKYLKDIQQRINTGEWAKIDICNLRPFFFLKHPLPLV
jgi:hypothetical protein